MADQDDSKNRIDPPRGANDGADIPALLERFVEVFDEFAAGAEALLEEEGEEEQQAIVGVLRDVLRQQTSGLRDTLASGFAAQDGETKRLAREYVDSSGLGELLERASGLMRDTEKKKKTVWEWIFFILEKIKNILLGIASIFPNFLSGIMDKVLLLLELVEKTLKNIAAFLSPRAAANAATADQIMWRTMENMWNAKSAWQRVTATG